MMLARSFQRPDWRAFLRERPLEEFLDWLALHQIEPWGEEREDRRWRRLMIELGAASESDDPLRELDYLGLMPERTYTEAEERARAVAAESNTADRLYSRDVGDF